MRTSKNKTINAPMNMNKKGKNRTRNKSKTRKREVVQARQISMYFSKKMTKSSLASIGAHCGGKDHATVLHACRTVNNLQETDKHFRKYLEDLEKKLSIA
jgi:chromosomal replication initiator protein